MWAASPARNRRPCRIGCADEAAHRQHALLGDRARRQVPAALALAEPLARAAPRSGRRTSPRGLSPGAPGGTAGSRTPSASSAARSRRGARRRSARRWTAPRRRGRRARRRGRCAPRCVAADAGTAARLGPKEPSQPTTTSASTRPGRPVGVGVGDVRVVRRQVVQPRVGDLVAELLAGGVPGLAQVLGDLGLPVDGDAAADQVDEVEVVPLVAATAGRCRGARSPHGAAARRGRRRRAGRRWTARGCPPGSAPRRSRGSGSRARPTRRPRARAGATSSSPAGPAPTMATWVRTRSAMRQCPGGASAAARPSFRPAEGGGRAVRGCGRCPPPRPGAPPRARPVAAEVGTTMPSAATTSPSAASHRHGDRAGAEPHLLARSAPSPRAGPGGAAPRAGRAG